MIGKLPNQCLSADVIPPLFRTQGVSPEALSSSDPSRPNVLLN
ncbi:MAG: hypothetical protein ACI9Z9_002941 [Litorivivens sp.]